MGFFAALVFARNGRSTRERCQRLFLYARKQLLLSFPAFQSNAPGRNQEARKRDEGKCSSISSTGLTKTSARSPGVFPTTRITCGFPKSCFSKLKLKPPSLTLNVSSESFRPLKHWGEP